MREDFLVGVGREIITPEIGCQLYGYRPDLYSESVNDDLTATAFYFRQGETQAVMITATVCLIATSLSDRILSLIEKETGIPKSHCILSATHTHSGPNVSGTFGWGDIDEKYCDEIFVPSILEAVKTAKENCRKATVKVSTGKSYVGINRRELTEGNGIGLGQNPWGVFNPEMTVISFEDEEKKNIGNIIHYGAHGTAAGLNTEITRDWSGFMTDSLERQTGGITAFFNGPEGDVGPRLTNGETTGNLSYAIELGGVAASDAVRIYRKKGAYHKGNLSAETFILNVPLDPRVDLETAKEMYEKYAGNTVNLDGAKAMYYKDIIESYKNGYKDKQTRPIEQTVICIGDVAFVSFPYELFSEIGMRIAQKSCVPYTLSLSNTNGSEGYYVTEDQICRGGYEIDMFKTSYIQPNSDNGDFHVFRQTVENLRKIKGE